jgi:hypothetical protein
MAEKFFAYLPKFLSWIEENFSQVKMHFTFNATSALEKEILMDGKPAMTCFKYQVYLI